MTEPSRPVTNGLPDDWWQRIAHDLRGPISPMRMAVQLLRTGRVAPADQAGTLQLIDRQIDQLLAAIIDVQELLRIQAGRFDVDMADGDLRLVADLLAGNDGLQRFLSERGQSLRVLAVEAVVAKHDPARVAGLLEFLVRRVSLQSPKAAVLSLSLHDRMGIVQVDLSGPELPWQDELLAALDGQDVEGEMAESRLLVLREVFRAHGARLRYPEGHGLTLELTAPAG